MPRQDELIAIIEVCVRSTQFLKGRQVDREKLKKSIDITWAYAHRVIQEKQKNRERVNAWNKAHPEAHRKHSRDAARRKAAQKKAMQKKGKK